MIVLTKPTSDKKKKSDNEKKIEIIKNVNIEFQDKTSEEKSYKTYYVDKDFVDLSDVKVSGGTLTAYNYVSGIAEYLEKAKMNLESVIAEDPSIKGRVYQTIQWINTYDPIKNKNQQELLSEGKPDLNKHENAIQEYKKLINNPEVKEPQLQDFFTKNYSLINLEIKELIPKQSFGGEFFPDFVAILHDLRHILIEIETPTKKLYTNKGNPTKEFSQAEQQLHDYLRWANANIDYLRKNDRKKPLPDISMENTSGLLIIGMIKDLDLVLKKKFVMKNFACNHYEIKTFDEILSQNQQQITNLRK